MLFKFVTVNEGGLLLYARISLMGARKGSCSEGRGREGSGEGSRLGYGCRVGETGQASGDVMSRLAPLVSLLSIFDM